MQAMTDVAGKPTDRVTVAQLGARMHYAVPEILHKAGMLERLFTDFYADGGGGVLSRLPSWAVPTALRRACGRGARLPREKVRAFTLLGLRYGYLRRRARSAADLVRVHLWAGDEFGRLVARHMPEATTAVYGFNSASLSLFRALGGRPVRRMVEQTIIPKACETRILAEERRTWPGWEAAGDAGGIEDEFAERERAEWELADDIVCGSEFVASQVAAISPFGPKCRVVPYGVDLSRFAAPEGGRRRVEPPLRVLFVGAVGLRKGVPWLLRAAGMLKGGEAVFRLVGAINCDAARLRAETPPNVEVLGPVPRAEVRAHYAWADVFCLPSLCEGSATVIYEALAAGLPVVTTPNTGSLVRDGLDGRVVPIRDPEATAEALRRLVHEPDLISRMRESVAQRRAAASWEAYAARVEALFHPPGGGGGAG